MNISREMGAAMATAVQRSRKQKTPRELATELEKALNLIEVLRAKTQRLEAQIALHPLTNGEIGAGGEGQFWTGETVEGRPVVTLAQAARACRISYQSAYRRIASGKWEATQLGSRDWRVFVDADGSPLMKASR